MNLVLDDSARKRMFKVIMRILRDPEAAEDATQDAMLTAFRKRDNFRGDCKPSTWLHRVAVSAALMYLRTQKRVQRLIAGDEGEKLIDLATEENTPETLVIERASAVHLRAAINNLPEQDREIIGRRLKEETDEEIAKAIGLSSGAVKSRAFRARRRLQTVAA